MAFMQEFHAKGRLSKGMEAAFITLILKKSSVDQIKDFRPISLIGSLYQILAKVLANRIQRCSQVLFPSLKVCL